MKLYTHWALARIVLLCAIVVIALSVFAGGASAGKSLRHTDDGGVGASTPICEPIRDPFTGREEIVCR
jgi:hypothetical protein